MVVVYVCGVAYQRILSQFQLVVLDWKLRKSLLLNFTTEKSYSGKYLKVLDQALNFQDDL